MNDNLIGLSVGNYVIKAEIGRGGMGTVYLAEHVRLGRRVAIKVLRREMGNDPLIVSRFFNEARAASDIRDPHIVDVVDFGDLPSGTPYLMMEYLEGRSLATVVAAEAPLPLGRVAHIVDGVCRALVAAHAHGVVHRDLKPDNILLVRREEDLEFVKVVDFGVAKLLVRSEGAAPQTAANAVLGTPEYMSPEQCRGENATLDGRSDLYSVGMIVYEMLAGRRPFEARTYVANIVAHLTTPPPSLRQFAPKVPEAVECVILRALQKDRGERHSSIEEFWNDFSAAAGTRTSPHHPLIGAAAVSIAPTQIRQALPTISPTAPTRMAALATAIAVRPSALSKVVMGVAILALVAVAGAAVVWTVRHAGSAATPTAAPATATGRPDVAAGAAGVAATASPVTAPVAVAPTPTPTPTPPVVAPTAPPPLGPARAPADARPAPHAARDRHSASATPPAAPAGAPASASAPSVVRGFDPQQLERRLVQESHQLAPSGRPYGAPLSGETSGGTGTDRSIELEGGYCYTLVSVATDPVRHLRTVLWDPTGKRVGEDDAAANVSCFTACAINSGTYRLHVRGVGAGRFRTAVLRSQ